MKKPSQIFDTPQATGFSRVTHNTREGIEEITWQDRFDVALEAPNTDGGFIYDLGEDYQSVDFDTDAIKEFIHQELQKAREGERERILLAIARIGKIDFRLSDVLDAINQSDKKCIMKKIEEYNEVMTQEELQALTQPNNK